MVIFPPSFQLFCMVAAAGCPSSCSITPLLSKTEKMGKKKNHLMSQDKGSLIKQNKRFILSCPAAAMSSQFLGRRAAVAIAMTLEGKCCHDEHTHTLPFSWLPLLSRYRVRRSLWSLWVSCPACVPSLDFVPSEESCRALTLLQSTGVLSAPS